MTDTERIFGAKTIAILDADPEARKRLRQAEEIAANPTFDRRHYDSLLLSTILACIRQNPAAWQAFLEVDFARCEEQWKANNPTAWPCTPAHARRGQSGAPDKATQEEGGAIMSRNFNEVIPRWHKCRISVELRDGQRTKWTGYETKRMPGIAITAPSTGADEWYIVHMASGKMLAQTRDPIALNTLQSRTFRVLRGIDWTRDLDAIRNDTDARQATRTLQFGL